MGRPMGIVEGGNNRGHCIQRSEVRADLRDLTTLSPHIFLAASANEICLLCGVSPYLIRYNFENRGSIPPDGLLKRAPCGPAWFRTWNIALQQLYRGMAVDA